jgi:hypothetical protein
VEEEALASYREILLMLRIDAPGGAEWVGGFDGP